MRPMSLGLVIPFLAALLGSAEAASNVTTLYNSNNAICDSQFHSNTLVTPANITVIGFESTVLHPNVNMVPNVEIDFRLQVIGQSAGSDARHFFRDFPSGTGFVITSPEVFTFYVACPASVGGTATHYFTILYTSP